MPRSLSITASYPPTIGITAPNPQLDLQDGPFRLNIEAQPWLHADADRPRRAGVSAFGFGGTNFHAVLEAYEGDPVAIPEPPIRDWPAELLAWSAADRDGLLRDLDRLAERLAAGARPPLRDLAHALAGRLGTPATGPTLAIVASSHEDLIAKLSLARDAIRGGSPAVTDPRGVYFAERPGLLGPEGRVPLPGSRIAGSRDAGRPGDPLRGGPPRLRGVRRGDPGPRPRADRAAWSFLLPPSTRRHAGGRTRPCERPRSPSRRSARRASAC